MSRPVIASVVLVSTLVGTIGCVPPPRVMENEEAAVRRSAGSPVDALFVGAWDNGVGIFDISEALFLVRDERQDLL